jgi:hypothetical protein
MGHSVNVKRMPLEVRLIHQHIGTSRVAALELRLKFSESEMRRHMLP